MVVRKDDQGEFLMVSNPNPLRSLLSPAHTEAEDALNAKFVDNPLALQKLAKQWSQLVVWSWLEPTDYPQQLGDDEEGLRQTFIETVKGLASLNIRGLYEKELANAPDPNNPDLNPFEAVSEQLSALLSGKTTVGNNKITLPALYNRLTKQDPASSDYIFNKTIGTRNFTDYFVWGILIDRFTGICVEHLDKDKPDKDKFVVLLACPARPALSPSVLTLKELQEWIADKGTGYLHPNPYIPTCNC
jgi:hypothetical protein